MLYKQEDTCSRIDESRFSSRLTGDRYLPIKYMDAVELQSALNSGKIWRPLFICCADMGAFIPVISSDSGALVIQNFGHKSPDDTELTEILEDQYVTHIFILGHSCCDFNKGAHQDSGHDVLEEIERIRQFPTLQTLARNRTIELHAWLYIESQNQLLVYDEAEATFISSKSPVLSSVCH